jgi:hypothetical protein
MSGITTDTFAFAFDIHSQKDLKKTECMKQYIRADILREIEPQISHTQLFEVVGWAIAVDKEL